MDTPENLPADAPTEARIESPAKSPAASLSPPDFRRNSFVVSLEEAGQKLFQCLVRRLCEGDETSLHRWIRTGQVRVNGKRTKAFDRLLAGDEIRLPPFAVLLSSHNDSASNSLVSGLLDASRTAGGTRTPRSAYSPRSLGLDILEHTDGILALYKPAGLPVQPGTGHSDSVTTRLHAHFAGTPFMPAPAHRLDRDTSGVLLIGTTYQSLRALTDAFAHRQTTKEYLCWCAGQWPHAESVTLHDVIAKTADAKNGERMRRVDKDNGGKDASLTVTPLRLGRHASLLHIELHTGRTHQIRIQLEFTGHPVAGDAKYGGRTAMLTGAPGLLLHAFRITLAHPDLPPHTFCAPPQWQGPWCYDKS